MMPGKWIAAVVVLSLLVFAITFILNYAGSGKSGGTSFVKDDKEPTGQLKLAFRSQRYPDDPKTPPVDAELHKVGWRDFWFKNENAKAVKIGLTEVNCKCSGVRVFTLPRGSKQEPGNESALTPRATEVKLSREDQTTAIVEPDHVGWLRLEWDGERQPSDAPTFLKATLWLNSPNDGPFLTFEVAVRFHEPLKMAREDMMQTIGTKGARELPFSFVLECWSVTRSDLPVTARLLDRDSEKDLLVVGKPERVTDAKELVAFARKHNEIKVAAAYRIPVTVRERGDATTPFDAGPFRRRIEISSPEDRQQPIVVELIGSIQGDLRVVGHSDFRVNLGKFKREKGSQEKVILIETQTDDLNLETDPARTAEFLEVALERDPDEKTKWRLRLKVKPNAASGAIPRDDDPKYRDSAIYVRQAGMPNARATRIAVEGTATD
jgi:hypothetical protein